jgi:cell division protein FtsW (lipid II flippase)
MFRNKIEFQALNKRYLKIVLVFVIFAFGLVCVSSTAVAEDEDEDDNDFKDRAKNLGVAALGLFSVSIVYVFFYQIFINSKKILPKNDKFDERRAKIQKTFLKVKKPLSLIHFFAGGTAIILLLIHGTTLIVEGNIKAILGLSTASLYITFGITGLIIKVVLKKFKKPKKLRRTLFKFHTSLIIFIIIISLHVTHVAYGD